MNRLISTYGKYSIWPLSEYYLYQLAEFVVCQNHKHHTREIKGDFRSQVLIVYKEELLHSKHSQILTVTASDGRIICSLRLINWSREQLLPMQTHFNLLSFMNALPCSTNIWHIGRFAVSAEVGSSGLTLFKLLLLYAMRPIYESNNDLALVRCDNKLLRTIRLMGVQIQSMGGSMEYLGSGTTPVYATRDGLANFFNKNRWLMDRCTVAIA